MGVNADQIQITENEFFSSTPEALAYKTDENLDRLYAYIVGAWGENSTTNVSCWEIAYRALKDKLKKIKGYMPAVTDEQRLWVRDTPGYIARELYKTNPEFRAAWDAIAEEEAELKKNPWLRTTAEQYKNFDPLWAAQRYVDDPQFKEMVERLISEGSI
jgi:hypothetical protein